MKLFAPIIAALVLSACSPKFTPPTDSASDFVQKCSGITATSEDQFAVASANCIGRVNGYALGAAVMAEMHELDHPWCVPENTTDGDVFRSVLSWITENPDRYRALAGMVDGRILSDAVIMAALRTKFVCGPQVTL